MEFNLSHSSELALLAVGHTHPLGIDLEFFSARPFQGIGQHVFSADENTQFHQLSPSIKPLAFFHLWSQKEAFIKAIGLGLAYPTQELSIPMLSPTHQQIIDQKYGSTWNVVSFMPEAACCAALCYHPTIQEIRYTKDA